MWIKESTIFVWPFSRLLSPVCWLDKRILSPAENVLCTLWCTVMPMDEKSEDMPHAVHSATWKNHSFSNRCNALCGLAFTHWQGLVDSWLTHRTKNPVARVWLLVVAGWRMLFSASESALVQTHQCLSHLHVHSTHKESCARSQSHIHLLMKDDLTVVQIMFDMGGDAAQLIEHWTSTLLTQVRFPGVTRDFSPSQLSVQTLLRVSVHSCMQFHGLISVSTLKIP